MWGRLLDCYPGNGSRQRRTALWLASGRNGGGEGHRSSPAVDRRVLLDRDQGHHRKPRAGSHPGGQPHVLHGPGVFVLQYRCTRRQDREQERRKIKSSPVAPCV